MLDVIRDDNPLAVPLLFDYDQIPVEHREAVELAAATIKQTVRRSASAIGSALTEVKGRLGHGQWLDWLQAEFGWSERTAENLMNAARLVAENENFSILSDSVQYMVGSPSTPVAARVEVLEMAETKTGTGNDGRVTVADAKRVVDAHRPPSVPISIKRVVGKCKVCGRPLTDPGSVVDACGKVCAAKLAAQLDPPADDDEDDFAGAPVYDYGGVDGEDDERAQPSPALTFGQQRQREKRERLAAWEGILPLVEYILQDTGNGGLDLKLRPLIRDVIQLYRQNV